MMEQVAAVFRKTGRSVPVFNDKHLSYSWEKAKQFVAWSHELKFPLMAGSSLPNGVTTQTNKPVRELDAAVPPPIRFQPAPLGRSNRSEPVTSPDAEGAGPRLGFEPLPAPHDSPLTLEINGPRQRSVGGAVTYELVVRNGSQQPIDHVVVNVDFDGELIFPGHIEKQVKKDLGNLLPGQSREMKLTLTSNKVGRHDCRFEVTADNLDPVWQTATVVYIAR